MSSASELSKRLLCEVGVDLELAGVRRRVVERLPPRPDDPGVRTGVLTEEGL